MKRTWRTIKEFPDYMISKYGEVRSFTSWKRCDYHILKLKRSKYYLIARLYYKGKVNIISVHRLVAKAFVPNPENKPEVNHIDGNKQNNYYKNLEWVTRKENCRHAWKIGLMENIRSAIKKINRKGEKHGRAKFTIKQIIFIKKELKRKSCKQIAEELNINKSTIDAISSGRNWGYVDPNRHKKRTIFY